MHKTRDILFVAWLEVTEGLNFSDYKILDERKKLGEFYFNDITHDKWEDCKRDFYNSTTTKTRYSVQRIKDLLNK